MRDWYEASITDPPTTAEYESAARAARIRAIEAPAEVELLGLATTVLGSAEAAAAWMSHPQIGRDRQRPRDLLTTGITVTSAQISRRRAARR